MSSMVRIANRDTSAEDARRAISKSWPSFEHAMIVAEKSPKRATLPETRELQIDARSHAVDGEIAYEKNRLSRLSVYDLPGPKP